ncbi:hypothetical protein WME98_36580 [Sorangium sp. So ce296]|uniref:Kelch repeat-containing protein n=1 Tax=Sorangium sp. So ce296 TaxID=3133296 RepID=UPI003F636092
MNVRPARGARHREPTLGARWPLLLALAVLTGACSLLADSALSDKPSEGGAGAPGSTSTGGCAPDCPADACCGGACVDLSQDPGHCGACGNACGAGESCCDGECTSVLNDPSNCGACGAACPNTLCVGGHCSSECVFGFDNCDGNIVTNGCEVDLTSDPERCGGCSLRCPSGAICDEGECACAPPLLDCDGLSDTGCETDGSSNPAHCGACGVTCGPNMECQAGVCGCQAGYADCNMAPDDGCEASLGTTESCRACGDACSDGMACDLIGGCACTNGLLDCDGLPGCESIVTDPATCGACGVQCPADTPRCDGTACVVTCAPGLTACGLSCVDTQTSPRHCGACGVVAGPHQHCEAGALACDADFADCDPSAPGCESDLARSTQHCGACGNACKPGAACVAGVCACGGFTPHDCGADCRACCSDADCSDGDGCTTDVCEAGGTACRRTGCAAGEQCCSLVACRQCCTSADCSGDEICSGGACIPPCGSGLVACDGACVSLSSVEHCGACGNACLSGRECRDGECTPPRVVMAAAGAPMPRQMAAAAWIGDALFVWGGRTANRDVNDGGLYDPARDAWSPLGIEGAPSARVLAGAAWTGSRVLVWGGGAFGSTAGLATGAAYDPAARTWRAMSTTNAPTARRSPIAVWTGTRLLIWGGAAGGAPVGGGALYDPVADAWSPVSSVGAAPARDGVAWAWSGAELYLFGGRAGDSTTGDGYAYNPTTDAWRALPSAGAPSPRADAFAVWIGSRLLVWGGVDKGDRDLGDGAIYDPAAGAWAAVDDKDAPSRRSRSERRTGWTAWTGTRALIAGGRSDSMPKKDGKLYDPAAGWGASVAVANRQHSYGVGVWTGTELILWSGFDGFSLLADGERFRP